MAYAPVIIASETEAAQAYPSPPSQAADYPVQSDPTMAHARLTELNDTALSSDNPNLDAEPLGAPQANIGEAAANAAAETNWDNSADLSASQEWVDVKVPRDAGETETSFTATSAAPTQTQSWADDHPDSPTAAGVSSLV